MNDILTPILIIDSTFATDLIHNSTNQLKNLIDSTFATDLIHNSTNQLKNQQWNN